ncbi:hypothetical protein AN641_08035 [Candidatus Epulonipiscioides gigas]|nr:hypothetical protein AN641_08035 [Epulopiscium sp. SCG-C07WGA-EpuloA2]
MNIIENVTIIGAGASGLVSAILLAKAGISVTLLEKNDKVGKKILSTGNGRCNLTNENLIPEKFHSNYKGDFFSPISKFNHIDTINFFSKLGIVPLIENKKVFPASEQASSILDVLRIQLDILGIKVITNTNVIDIKYKNDYFTLFSETQIYKTKKVIIATGGLAGVKEDYTIYKVIKKLGHKIEPLLPTLVHLKSTSPYCKMMQGIRIKANVTIGKKSEYGEILFTEDGLSGPAIFNVSRTASVFNANSKKVILSLDLCKDMSVENIVNMIYERIEKNLHHTLEEMFLGWFNKKVAISIIKASKIGKVTKKVNLLEYEEIEHLANTMKQFNFEISGTRSFKFAQATIGGVSLEDIYIETMESKKIKGLFFTGEVIDVDGDCGGYNLQWAWSTSVAVARSIKND